MWVCLIDNIQRRIRFPGVLLVFLVESGKRRGTNGLNNGYLWQSVDKSHCQQLAKTFPKCGTVTQVSARHYEMVGHLPVKLLGEFHGHGLLSFNSKRINRIDQIDGSLFGEFADYSHTGIEVSFNLENLSTVIQGLGQLRMAQLACGNHDRAKDSGSRSVRGQASRRITGAGASHQTLTENRRLGYRHSHPGVLEGSSRVVALMFEFQGVQPAVSR